VDFPTIPNVDMQTVALLGLWLFVSIQFNKGKVWPDSWTGRVSLLAPIVLGWVPVWGSANLNAYAQVMAVLYLIATGYWAINKAGKANPPQQG